MAAICSTTHLYNSLKRLTGDPACQLPSLRVSGRPNKSKIKASPLPEQPMHHAPGQAAHARTALEKSSAGTASATFCTLNSSNFSEKQCAHALTAPSVVEGSVPQLHSALRLETSHEKSPRAPAKIPNLWKLHKQQQPRLTCCPSHTGPDSGAKSPYTHDRWSTNLG